MGLPAKPEPPTEKHLDAGALSSGKTARSVGNQLRVRRQQMRLTLDQVAASAGLTKGFLSDIERDRALPSLSSLLRLCQAMDMEVSSLFEEKTDSPIVRAGKRKLAVGFGIGMTEYQVTPGTEGRLLALLSEMEPGASSGDEEYSLNCEQCFAYVLLGRINISIEKKEHILEAGDTLTYDPLRQHSIRNASNNEPAKALFVLTPPPR